MATKIPFEMGAKWESGWESDNRTQTQVNDETHTLPPDKHRLTVTVEKRRRKTVTVVSTFYLATKELDALAKKVKKKLATGGARKKDTLEFQGDVTDRVRLLLRNEGFGCD